MIAERLNNVILVTVLMLATLINVELMLFAQLASMSLPVPAHQIILEIQRKHVTQFHLLDPLKLLLGVAMIRNVLIGMPALILNAKTLVHPTLVQLKLSVAHTTTKLDALVLKVGQEIRK
jgi:Sec-independent protein secretion pathway component TatC